MEIITEKTLANSRAFVFVIDQWAKLLKNGHGGHSICFTNSSRVTYALNDLGEVVAAVVYNFDQNIREGWICMAAVAEDHRGLGIYSQIFDKVCDECRSAGMKIIASNIHVDNSSMLKSADKQQRQLASYRTKKVL